MRYKTILMVPFERSVDYE